MRSRSWSRTLADCKGGKGVVLDFMVCYYCGCIQYMPRQPELQAAFAWIDCAMLWRSSDVMRQNCRQKTKLSSITPAIKLDYTVCLQEHVKETVCIYLSTLKQNERKSFTA